MSEALAHLFLDGERYTGWLETRKDGAHGDHYFYLGDTRVRFVQIDRYRATVGSGRATTEIHFRSIP